MCGQNCALLAQVCSTSTALLPGSQMLCGAMSQTCSGSCGAACGCSVSSVTTCGAEETACLGDKNDPMTTLWCKLQWGFCLSVTAAECMSEASMQMMQAMMGGMMAQMMPAGARK